MASVYFKHSTPVQWEDIQGFEGIYQVSNQGQVKRLSRTQVDKSGRTQNYKEKILKTRLRDDGYVDVCLWDSKTNKKFIPKVHRLVAQAFIPNPLNKDFVNHKDGNKSNNNSYNLEWCTQSENENHAWETGLKVGGEKHYSSKLTKYQVGEIRKSYIPYSKDFSMSALAKKYNVSPNAIFSIIHRLTWNRGDI